MSQPASVPARLWPVVVSLGISQIIGYGTVFYCYAIFAPTMAADLGVDPAVLFGLLSAGLLTGGLAGPWLGRMMDQVGAAQVMALGSIGSGLLLAAMAVSPEIVSFSVAVLALLTLSPTVFYSAAFVAAAAARPTEARRVITNLTLIAGFSSSLFWPLSGWLLEAIGWRSSLLLYAGANILVALPLHLFIARRTGRPPKREARDGSTAGHSAAERQIRRRTFWLVSASYGLSALPASAMIVHMVQVFQDFGLGAAAFAVAALFGPSQVMARLVDSVFGRRLHPLSTAVIAFGATALCMGALLLPLPPLAAAAIATVFFGIGQGLTSIVIGTLPLALFGHEGYGELVGRIGLVRLAFSSGAPFLLSALLGSIGFTTSFLLLFMIALAALPPLFILIRRHGWRA